jgi:GTP-binding protein HflX
VTLRGQTDETPKPASTSSRCSSTPPGADVVGRLVQRRDTPDHTWFIGKGKVDELREICLAVDADTVVFDNDLSPAQQFNLEKALGRTPLDRTA